MNALQYSKQATQPIQKNRVIERPKRRLRQRSHHIMALETTMKIGVNFAIAAAAVSALIQLLPYHWSQQDKLRAIRTEVNVTQERVNRLQIELKRNFDPRQAQTLMRQQGYRFDPKQKQVVFPNAEAADVD